MKRLHAGTTGLFLFVLIGGASLFGRAHGDEEPENPVGKLMKRKLTHAHGLLEALATEDFESLAKHSRALNRISEEASWQVLPGIEYVRYSSEFQRITNEMTVAANDKQLDSATLQYVQLTVNCVECHKYVRKSKLD